MAGKRTTFRAEFKKQLGKVVKLYQSAKVEVTESDLVLYPSPTSIRTPTINT